MKLARITLKRNKEESLNRRHPWIFSGAIAASEGAPEEGDIVEVYTSGGDFIAMGHCQIGSIAVRVLSFEQVDINEEWWLKRIEQAYSVRKALGFIDNPHTTCYRLVHGEGDNLAGLIIDIYGKTTVIQSHSVGMYLAYDAIVDAIRKIYGSGITAIYSKSSHTLPSNTDMDVADGYIWRAEQEGKTNEPKDENSVLENDNKFLVNWERGQKTGFFIDQRENRELIKRYAHGRRVLNTFSYTGGFSIYALAGGAVGVDSVDSSEHAMELATKNVELNFGKDAPHRSIAADAMAFMKDVEGDLYDMIIVDPPAFAKHHKVLGNATQGYKRLNINALNKIKSGGILFTFSCSQAMSKDLFRTTIFSAAAIAGRNVRILHQLTQPADHPISIYHPEGEYLKGLVLYVE